MVLGRFHFYCAWVEVLPWYSKESVIGIEDVISEYFVSHKLYIALLYSIIKIRVPVLYYSH